MKTLSSNNASGLRIKNRTDLSIKPSVSVDQPTPDKEISPKHTKRKILDSYFDHKSKRKFPGPAGLLNGSFKENNDEVVCHMELLSQVSLFCTLLLIFVKRDDQRHCIYYFRM